MGRHRLKLLIALVILPLFAFGIHKYYISLTQVEYVKENASLQIISRYFIDDLEHTLEKEYQQDFELNTKQEIDSVDSYYQEYLSQHLIFTINDSIYTFNYIGKEYDADIVYLYLEIPNIKRLESLEIKNTSLFKYFPEQQNITKLKINNKHTTFYLSKQKDKGLLNF
ncbi:MAG: peptidase E [Flavobacteriaceae bacterium]|nr:MAG: peptidase E [Flavobacteriaceae bacterium]